MNKPPDANDILREEGPEALRRAFDASHSKEAKGNTTALNAAGLSANRPTLQLEPDGYALVAEKVEELLIASGAATGSCFRSSASSTTLVASASRPSSSTKSRSTISAS